MLLTMMKRSAIAAAIVLLSFNAYAVANDLKTVTVPPGDLAAALESLGKQFGVDVIYPSEQVRGLKTSGISGTLEVEAAFRKLLEGTPLALKFNAGAMLITLPKTSGHDASAVNDNASSAGAGARVAQAANLSAGTQEGNAGLGAATSSEGEQASEGSRSQELPAPGESGKAIPEVLVKGSRTINSDIRRTENDSQPYVVFDRETLEQSTATTVEQFLKTRLPMNAVQGTRSQSALGTAGAQSQIDLRGLGTNQTLILVDGRRMPSVNSGAQFGQPDINGIPLASIERIEVLPATASGIYGGGATGGVVNVILRRDFTGVDARVTYGNTFEADADLRRVDLGGGFSFNGGRTRLTLGASHSDSGPLLVGDRDYVDLGRALQLANNPAAIFTAATPPIGYTTNIRSRNGSNLVLDNGTALNSPVTFVPVGYAGPSTDGGAALVGNAGLYNLDLPESLSGAQQSLLSNPEVNSASVNLRRELGSALEAFVDLSWLENKGRTDFATVPSSVNIPGNASNNPFTTEITVSFPAVGLSYPRQADTETWRGTGGLIWRLPHEWSVGLDYGYSRSRFATVFTNIAAGDPDGTGPNPSVTTALGNGTLNVLQDVNAFPLDYSPYLLPSPNLLQSSDTLHQDGTLRFSGPVFELPGGAITLSAAAEHRREEAEDTYQDRMTVSAVSSVLFWPSITQKVTSYYLETRTPFFSEANELPFLKALELQASVRHDGYDTEASTTRSVSLPTRDSPKPAFSYETNSVEATKYTLSLRYQPLASVSLRATYGTGFLPPGIDQLQPVAPFSSTATLTDPKRGGVSASTGPFQASGGGSIDLEPEDSESWSAGLIFTPSFLPGLRLSVDYVSITKSDEITALSQQGALDLEDVLPGRVTRAPLTATDAALGYTGGVITAIDSSLLNIAATEVNAYDLQLDYSLKTEGFGDFQFYTVATWQRLFERQTLPTSPVVDSTGFTGGPLEWRGNFGMTWDFRSWTAGWNAQYYDSYVVHAANATAATIAATTLSQGSSQISSQTYADVFVRYRTGPSLAVMGGALENVELMLGVENVFDERPPILATTGASGGYSLYGDPRLRRYAFTVRKTF